MKEIKLIRYMNNFYFVISSIIIFGGILVLIPHIIWLISKIIGYFAHFHVSYRPFGYTSIILFSIWILTVIIGNTIGRFRHEIVKKEIILKGLPDKFNGYKIVHISDLHLKGWEGHEKKLAEYVEEINAIHPDIICFTGDLVSTSANEIKPFADILSRLKAKDGVYSVMGNHDYIPYNHTLTDNERWWAVEQVINSERNDLGWDLLINENRIIKRGNDSIAILGCENQSVGFLNVVQRADMLKTTKGTEGMFRILLTHDPSQWRQEIVAQTDIELTLAGHTHALQVRLFGITPAKLFYPECDGLYKEKDQYLYVNIGLGGTLPFRIGATPEITVLTLRK